jgi:hypothetical protein
MFRRASTVTADETTTRLMRANLLEVFDERDGDARRDAIERTYAPDVQWSDDEGVAVGIAALDAKAELLHQQIGDLRFREAGSVHGTRGLGYLAWKLAPSGGPAAASGFDVAIIVENRIATLYTVLT